MRHSSGRPPSQRRLNEKFCLLLKSAIFRQVNGLVCEVSLPSGYGPVQPVLDCCAFLVEPAAVLSSAGVVQHALYNLHRALHVKDALPLAGIILRHRLHFNTSSAGNVGLAAVK